MRKKYVNSRLAFANAQSGQCSCCLVSTSFTADQERGRFREQYAYAQADQLDRQPKY